MDALLVAARLPRLAERTICRAIVSSISRASVTPRALVDGALLRFERDIARIAADGVRPALLFAERDRIVRDLRVYLDSALAVRLAALARRNLIAAGAAAQPFDAIVTGRRGGSYAVVLRKLGDGDRRFKMLSSIKEALATYAPVLDGAIIYDLATGRTLHIRSGAQYRTRAA